MRTIDRSICGEIYSADEVFMNYKELCLRFRGRFSGSADAQGAAAFIAEKLSSYGLSQVQLEKFPMTVWTRGNVHLEMLTPVRRVFPCLALPYAPSCDQEFELYDAGMGLPEDVLAAGSEIAGRAVLVDDINPSGKRPLHRLQKYVPLQKAGAGAFLFVRDGDGMLAPTGSLAFNHDGPPDQALPSVGLPREVGLELREWSKRGPVTLKLVMDNTLVQGEDANVTGELKGPAGDGQLIIIGGHYDGHDIAHGAGDNASGTVAVMEMARALSPLQHRLRGTLRFVLFGSEEMGMVGSHAHVRACGQDLSRLRFVFNLDCVGSPGPVFLMLHHSTELMPWFTAAVASMAADIDLTERVLPFSDHFPFYLRGVPCAFIGTRGGSGRGWGHTIADTVDKVTREPLQRSSAHLARLVIRADQQESWPGRRRSPEEIRQEIAPFAVHELLEYEGHSF